MPWRKSWSSVARLAGDTGALKSEGRSWESRFDETIARPWLSTVRSARLATSWLTSQAIASPAASSTAPA